MTQTRRNSARSRTAVLLLGALVALAGCQHWQMVPTDRNQSVDPDDRLADVLRELDAVRSVNQNVAADMSAQRTIADNTQLVTQLDRLALEYPQHVPTLLAAGALAAQRNDTEKAIQYLDRAIALDPSPQEAIALRAQLAMREGNLQYAKRLLSTHIRRAPHCVEMRETYAAVLYFAGDMNDAEMQLDAAQELGAPVWRVEYHRGLIAERRGDTARAKQAYTAAVAANPSFAPAQSRLTGVSRVQRAVPR